MKKILIVIFSLCSYQLIAQFTASSFTYNGVTYDVDLGEVGEAGRLFFIKNTANKSGTGYFPPVTGNYSDCSPSQVFDVRYLLNKAKEAINGAIDAQTRYIIRNNETFEVRLTVTIENKIEPTFILKPRTILTPADIYAMDMAIRQIPITFNPRGACVGINLSSISTRLPNQPSLDQ
ncbi:MAG: hypothetical protein ACK40K_07195 [Raineya sp.]